MGHDAWGRSAKDNMQGRRLVACKGKPRGCAPRSERYRPGHSENDAANNDAFPQHPLRFAVSIPTRTQPRVRVCNRIQERLIAHIEETPGQLIEAAVYSYRRRYYVCLGKRCRGATCDNARLASRAFKHTRASRPVWSRNYCEHSGR